MWDLFPNLSFRFPNLGRNNPNTIPSVNVTVGTENVTIELPNHAFYRRDYVGGFYLNLREAIPAGRDDGHAARLDRRERRYPSADGDDRHAGDGGQPRRGGDLRPSLQQGDERAVSRERRIPAFGYRGGSLIKVPRIYMWYFVSLHNESIL